MARRVAGRIRRGVTGTAAAAVAVAMLTASQPPSPVAQEVTGQPDVSLPGDAYYYTALPPLSVRGGTLPPRRPAPAVTDGTEDGAVPAIVLDAYRKAEAAVARSTPSCALRWQLLAAIGQVESAQARGGRVDRSGTTYAPIRGPRLDGNGFATIHDTDDGAYDGDTAYDRAVGPMQFIPSTWARWGSDGNGDGSADPHNVYDAALAAGRYLCAGGRVLSDPDDLDRAVLSYNRSREYLRVVRSWFAYFLNGHIPDGSGWGGLYGDGLSGGSDAGPAGAAPSSAPPARPRSPRPRTGTSPSVAPAPSAASKPTPAPTPTRSPEPSPTPSFTPPPAVTTPGTGIGLPDDPVLPTTGPLTP
ncbi:lytic transglycosylase domain-containing protein [Streptomyces sp. NPDC006551]|uniref:lytic transglycosylase domain-containing protein n=1 Tax=Streptomyces sp. NPDC006551 TaxID=3157178 RepID=UPI0033B24237